LFACWRSLRAAPSGNQGQQQVTSTSPPSDCENLAGTRWTLVSMSKPEEETPVIKGSSVTLEFQEGGPVGGSGGCNSFGGQYQIEGNSISFQEIFSTLMDENRGATCTVRASVSLTLMERDVG
jgi:heat shock protein HslJ